jgi:hypothetical protein
MYVMPRYVANPGHPLWSETVVREVPTYVASQFDVSVYREMTCYNLHISHVGATMSEISLYTERVL